MSQDNTNLKVIYDQYWNHTRHIENERLAITTIYGAAIAAGLSMVFRVGQPPLPCFAKIVILAFLAALSLIGLAISVRILVTFVQLYDALRRLTQKLCPCEKLDWEDMQVFTKGIKQTEPKLSRLYLLLIRICSPTGIPLPLTLLFPALYIAGLFVSLVLLVLASMGRV